MLHLSNSSCHLPTYSFCNLDIDLETTFTVSEFTESGVAGYDMEEASLTADDLR